MKSCNSHYEWKCVYLLFIEEGERKRHEGRKEGGSDPEVSSCDSFSIQSTHHRTISDLIKQTERDEGKKEKQRGKMRGREKKVMMKKK